MISSNQWKHNISQTSNLTPLNSFLRQEGRNIAVAVAVAAAAAEHIVAAVDMFEEQALPLQHQRSSSSTALADSFLLHSERCTAHHKLKQFAFAAFVAAASVVAD